MNIKVNKLALAIGITFAVATSSANALLISTSVESSVAITINGVTASTSSGPSNSATSEIIDHPVSHNFGRGKAVGNDTGYSQLLAEGPWYTQVENHFDMAFSYKALSTVTHTAVITNDSAYSQNIDFSFLINAGEINHGSSSVYESPGDYVHAGYSADIRVNSASVWSSAGESQANYDGTHSYGGNNLVLSGVDLGGTAGTGSWPTGPVGVYSWADYYGNATLGMLNPGQSLTLEYSLVAYVNEYFETSGYSYTPRATIGDPFNFGATPLFSDDKFVTSPADAPSDVPEPAGTLLLGAGLAALAFRRRKDRKTNI